MLTKLEGEREKAIMLQRLAGSRAIKRWNDARGNMSVALCVASGACGREEVGSDSSRKMQDKDETTSEAS